MRIILSDLDGVLADSTAHACRVLWNQYGRLMVPKEVNEYNVGKVFARLQALNYEDVDKFLQGSCWGNPLFYAFVSPYWTVWQTYLRLLEAKDIQLIFVTARAGYAADTNAEAIRETTRKWLDTHGFAMCEIHYLADHPRIDWVLQYRGDVKVFYIDDKASTMRDLLSLRSQYTAGLRVHPVLLNRPWNRSLFLKHDDLERYRLSEGALRPLFLNERMP